MINTNIFINIFNKKYVIIYSNKYFLFITFDLIIKYNK